MDIENQTTARLKVEYRKVDDLIPYARNARTHSDAQVAEIAASIKEYGWTNPILTDGENGIIAGHGRLLAARKLGMTEVPTIDICGLSDVQKRALILADNKLALNAGWDAEMLKLELSDLLEIGGRQNLVVGFSDEELDEILGASEEDAEEEQGVEERISEALKIKPVSHFGDIWVCGPHRVMCGDSTDEQTISKLCSHADLLLTDPPYGINVVSHKEGGKVGGDKSVTFGKVVGAGMETLGFITERGKGVGKVSARKYLAVKDDDSTETARKACLIAKRITDDQIIFGGNYFTDFLPPSRCWLVWDKKNGDSVFADCELAWTSYKTSVRKYEWMWNGLARQGDRTDEGLTRIHPTQKPVGLIAEILEDYTAEGQTVLDLFGGSGSTLIASEKTGRVCCLMEYERAYVDLIVRRWQDYSGKRAFRESDGRFFDDVKNEERDETTADSDRP